MSAPTGALAVLGRRRAGRIVDGGPADRGHDHAPWLSGVLAAAQACVLTVLLVTLPALVVFVLSSGDPTNADTSWFASVQVGLALWLLAHGVPVVAGATTVSMVPLGLTLLCGFVLHASARRTARPTGGAFGAGVATYAVAAVLLVLVAGLAGLPQLATAALGGALVAALGLGCGIVTQPDGPRLADVLEPLTARLPATLRLGLRAGLLATALALVPATVLVVWWTFLGRSDVLDVVHALGVDGFDAVALAVGQTTFVADVVVWALAWLSGVGFAVGTGSVFSPTAAVVGPMPVVPLVGVVPTDPPAAAWVAAPVVLVLLGALVGVFLHRRVPDRRWSSLALALVTTAATAGLATGVLVSFASGGVGPGRMQHLGADALVVGLVVAGEVLLGAALVMTLAHPSTVAGVRALVARARGAVRRDGRAGTSTHDAEPAAPATASATSPTTTPATASATSRTSATVSSAAGSAGTARSSTTARTAGTTGTARTTSTTLTARTTGTTLTAGTTSTARTAATAAGTADARTGVTPASVVTSASAPSSTTSVTSPTAASAAGTEGAANEGAASTRSAD